MEARIYNTRANVGIAGTTPSIRASNFQTGRAGDVNVIQPGTPIGLLLTLTYSSAFTVQLPNYSDFRPNVRIRGT